MFVWKKKKKEEKIRKEKSEIKRKKIEEMRKVKNSMWFMLGKLMWMLVGMKSCELIFDFRCGLNILKKSFSCVHDHSYSCHLHRSIMIVTKLCLNNKGQQIRSHAQPKREFCILPHTSKPKVEFIFLTRSLTK